MSLVLAIFGLGSGGNLGSPFWSIHTYLSILIMKAVS